MASPMSPVVDRLIADCRLPRSEALLLLEAATGLRRERLITGSRDPVGPGEAETFDALARRRRAGEPVAYLLGWREFYGRRFAVDADVLIPRPETELLVDRALRWVDARGATGAVLRVLDLGTGTGVIAVTLALERPTLAVATDASAAALAVAARNAANLGASVRFALGDWFDALAGGAGPPLEDSGSDGFDLIVSNPPYVASDDPHLSTGDLRFEPRQALTDFGDGLGAIRRIVAGAGPHLRPGGAVMIEHGHDQAAAVRRLMAAAHLSSIETERDLAGIERLTMGVATDRPAHADL